MWSPARAITVTVCIQQQVGLIIVQFVMSDNRCKIEKRIIITGVLPVKEAQMRCADNVFGNEIVMATLENLRRSYRRHNLCAMPGDFFVLVRDVRKVTRCSIGRIERPARKRQRVQPFQGNRQVDEILLDQQIRRGQYLALQILAQVCLCVDKQYATGEILIRRGRLDSRLGLATVVGSGTREVVDFEYGAMAIGIEQVKSIRHATGKLTKFCMFPAGYARES